MFSDIHLLPVISDYVAEPEAFRLETKGLEEEATINWDNTLRAQVVVDLLLLFN